MNKPDFEALFLKYQKVCHEKEIIENEILAEINKQYGLDWWEDDKLNILGTVVDFGKDWNRDNFSFDQFLTWLDKMKQEKEDLTSNNNSD